MKEREKKTKQTIKYQQQQGQQNNIKEKQKQNHKRGFSQSLD